MLINKIYIKALNYIYDNHICKIDEKVRMAYLWCIFLSFSAFFIMSFSGIFNYTLLNKNTQRQVFAGGLILLAAAFSMNDRLHPVKWNKMICVPYYIGAAGLVLTGIMHPTGDGYLNFGFMLILVYPCLYVVWNNRKDYETLFDMLAESNLIVNTLYVVYCVLFFSKDFMQYTDGAGRYFGTMQNANYFSFTGMMMCCSAIYMAYRRRNDMRKAAIYLVLAVPGVVIAWSGQSRSAILAVSLSTVATLIFCMKKRMLQGVDKKKMAIVLAGALLVSAAFIFLHEAGGLNENEAEQGGSAISRFSMEGKDLNTYTSGRIELWKIYVPMINLTGNDVDAINWDELPVTQAAHCHNTFIEFGYRCGIFVAMAFLCLKLMAGLISLWYLFSPRKIHGRYLYAVIVMIIYEICSLFDVATLPMERYAPFYFYLIIALLIDAGSGAAKNLKGNDAEKAGV